MAGKNGTDNSSLPEKKLSHEIPEPWKMNHPGWDPILALKTIHTTMNELVADIFYQAGKTPYELPWKPLMDMYRDGENLYIDLELTGARKENIDIQATGNLVIIQGLIEDPGSGTPGQLFSKERKTGGFSRSIPLPYRVKQEMMKASFKNGLLKITIPLTTDKKGENIKITID